MAEWIQQNPSLAPVAFAAFFVGLWLVMGFVISLMGGWWSLAERYRTDRPFPAHVRRFQRGQMRFMINYNGVLTVASDAEGVYLGMMFLFRLGHPPLFVRGATSRSVILRAGSFSRCRRSA